MRRFLRESFLISSLAAMVLLTGCGGTEEQSAASSSEESIRIGISQIVEHPALDAAKNGFIDYLNENGYEEGTKVTYDFQNAQGDMNTAIAIGQKFSSDRPNLVFSIATPTTQAVAQTVKDIPIVFTAVTDPLSAKIVSDMDRPGANITGTSDMNPIREQLELIKAVKPDAKKVGVLYNSGEANSVIQIDLAKKIAPELGLELIERAVTNSSEVKQAAESLGDIDAFYIGTDNTVYSALDTIFMLAEKEKLPVIAGESEAVKKGALITYGIDYYELGRQTGEMALKVLSGQGQPGEMPVETQKNLKLYINKQAAERFGIVLPDELLKQADEIIE
ncbi:ABC transporter substrate-binding protein [Ammoniphilus sp. CFH 90114]|uniref:ABC transporter substrate-binding protein n=1 Tax=Ammoniphilus sp. CFH 90114 TaxID=2493665 RepID=UPI00100F27E6|nr:ABC transporter substrate-binding protein [Ammoniphilus sp. CFH 90114]RXT06558.1 ABC transporter substrate-binding protein [Ammoniphilus sp. CFH 90114]